MSAADAAFACALEHWKSESLQAAGPHLRGAGTPRGAALGRRARRRLRHGPVRGRAAPLAGGLVGLDLSARMGERARALGLYDELVVADLVAWLSGDGCAGAFDAIVAADVLVYFGGLGAPLRAGEQHHRVPALANDLTGARASRGDSCCAAVSAPSVTLLHGFTSGPDPV